MEKNLQSNFTKQWFETQGKMFDVWQEVMQSFSGLGATKTGEESVANDIFNDGMKSMGEFYENWTQEVSQLFEKDISSFQNSTQEAISKMFGGASLYQDLNKFWADLTTNITGKDFEIKNFYDKWKDNYIKMISEYFISNMPEQVQGFYREPMNIMNMYKDSTSKFLNPWEADLQKLSNLLTKGISGDTESYIEFNKVWSENFSKTFGKLFTMPEFSMNRENMQKQMAMVNELTRYITSMNEFFATMTKQNQETFKDIVESYQDMVKDGNNPKTFKEFYDYWLKRNEEAYRKFFVTDEYSKLMAQVLDSYVNYKKEYDNYMEKALEFLPYPSKTDMDSVYKTIDVLKRDVRELKKEISALKNIKETKTTVKATNTTTEKK